MDIVMYLSAILAIGIVIYMLIKKMDIKIALFGTGLVLIYIALLMGKNIGSEDFVGTGIKFFDPLLIVVGNFKNTLSNAGFIILILGGFTAYMSQIGANDMTVSALMKPIQKIKSPYILVPIIFLLGNMMSLVVPSASNLAIILLATLMPIMKAANMSLLTIAGVIATTATVMPTPLGGDNVAIATELANHSQFANLTVTQYVFQYHAIVSVPTLLVMALVHYLWQKHRDKKDSNVNFTDNTIVEVPEIEKELIEGSTLKRGIYALLPVMPILILLIVFFVNILLGTSINLSVESVTIFSFILAAIVEIIYNNDLSKNINEMETFFKGMGQSMGIVVLLVAASTFVSELQSIGLIATLQDLMQNVQGSNLGFVLPLILVLISIVIVLISGSGTALFYAMVPLVVPLAQAAGINPIAVAVPMGLAGNLVRAVSPVSAVVMIVAGSTKLEPLEIVKRTSIPMIAGLLVMFVLSMLFFL